MSDPVLSPFGDTFDRATIVEHLRCHGDRCPLGDGTRVLREVDLVPAGEALRQELSAYRFGVLTQRGF